jgi:hypothetical protein
VFENRMLRRIFASLRGVKEAGENCLTRSSIIFTFHQILLG